MWFKCFNPVFLYKTARQVESLIFLHWQTAVLQVRFLQVDLPTLLTTGTGEHVPAVAPAFRWLVESVGCAPRSLHWTLETHTVVLLAEIFHYCCYSLSLSAFVGFLCIQSSFHIYYDIVFYGFFPYCFGCYLEERGGNCFTDQCRNKKYSLNFWDRNRNTKI